MILTNLFVVNPVIKFFNIIPSVTSAWCVISSEVGAALKLVDRKFVWLYVCKYKVCMENKQSMVVTGTLWSAFIANYCYNQQQLETVCTFNLERICSQTRLCHSCVWLHTLSNFHTHTHTHNGDDTLPGCTFNVQIRVPLLGENSFLHLVIFTGLLIIQ